MTRRLLNLLTLLSLVLCVAVCVLWAKGFWVSDYVRHVTPTRYAGVVEIREWSAAAGSGRVTVSRGLYRFRMRDDVEENFIRGWESERHQPVKLMFRPGYTPTLAQRLGFLWDGGEYAGSDGSVQRHRRVAWPLWAPASLLAAVPAARVYRRLRRHPTGCCQTCGYDLTGNVSGVCPECGQST